MLPADGAAARVAVFLQRGKYCHSFLSACLIEWRSLGDGVGREEREVGRQWAGKREGGREWGVGTESSSRVCVCVWGGGGGGQRERMRRNLSCTGRGVGVGGIIGGSYHKYHFCRDKHVFIATKHVLCRDKSILILSRQNYV